MGGLSMQTIRIHLVTAEDTVESIVDKYTCNREDIERMNPLFRYRGLCPGQLLYIPLEEKEKILPEKNDVYYGLIREITYLAKEDYASYIQKHNDHILIEDKLFYSYKKMSVHLFKENENNQKICASHLIDLHRKLHAFADVLIQKDENSISESKKNLKESMQSFYQFLTAEHMQCDMKKISESVQSRMLMIAKIANGNFYDLWSIIDDAIHTV